MAQKMHSFRAEVDKEIACRFLAKIRELGYRTYSEWLREKIRQTIGLQITKDGGDKNGK